MPFVRHDHAEQARRRQHRKATGEEEDVDVGHTVEHAGELRGQHGLVRLNRLLPNPRGVADDRIKTGIHPALDLLCRPCLRPVEDLGKLQLPVKDPFLPRRTKHRLAKRCISLRQLAPLDERLGVTLSERRRRVTPMLVGDFVWPSARRCQTTAKCNTSRMRLNGAS